MNKEERKKKIIEFMQGKEFVLWSDLLKAVNESGNNVNTIIRHDTMFKKVERGKYALVSTIVVQNNEDKTSSINGVD